MLQYEMKSSVSTYSDSCRDVSLVDNALRYPDIKLTRVENDASCLKYLPTSYKRQRFEPLFCNLDSGASSERDSPSEDSNISEYNVSEDEPSSDDSVEKPSRVRINRVSYKYCKKAQSNSLNTSKDIKISSPTPGKVTHQFLKFPIIKLIRLENDQSCFKYLDQNPRLKMPEKKTDKKLNPIVIVTNPSNRGKHKTSFMIKKPESEGQSPSEESKDSCYDTLSVNDSDSSSCNKVKTSCKLNSSDQPFSLQARKCSVSIKPLVIQPEEGHTSRRAEMSDSTEISGDIASEDSSSSVQEVASGRISRNDLDSGSSLSEIISEESCSSEIARVFEHALSSEENSNSSYMEEESSPTGLVESDITKTLDSGIGISDDTMVESFILKPTFILEPRFVIPNEDSDIAEGEERFIVDVEFIPDDVYERLKRGASRPETPIEATCKLCGEVFSSRSNLYQHMEESHNCGSVYECAHCGQVFSVKACLVYHLYAKVIVGGERIPDENDLCPNYQCSKEDLTNWELDFLSSFCSNHLTLHSQLTKSESADQTSGLDVEGTEVKIEEKPHSFECLTEERCAKSALISCVDKNEGHFKRKGKSIRGLALQKRRKLTNTAIPHRSSQTCHLCNRIYTDTKRLLEHFEDAHNNIYYFECRLCRKLFQNSTSFASHFAKKECNKVRGPTVLRCEVCRSQFKNHTFLRKHKMNLHKLFIPLDTSRFVEFLTKLPPTETFLNCKFCYESFSCAIELLEHERDSHDYFTCFEPHCSAKFISRDELENHLFIHFAPGESSFCEFCSKLFFTKQYLVKHIQSHLRNED